MKESERAQPLILLHASLDSERSNRPEARDSEEKALED